MFYFHETAIIGFSKIDCSYHGSKYLLVNDMVILYWPSTLPSKTVSNGSSIQGVVHSLIIYGAEYIVRQFIRTTEGEHMLIKWSSKVSQVNDPIQINTYTSDALRDNGDVLGLWPSGREGLLRNLCGYSNRHLSTGETQPHTW
jgi:hypothetical protein